MQFATFRTSVYRLTFNKEKSWNLHGRKADKKRDSV